MSPSARARLRSRFPGAALPKILIDGALIALSYPLAYWLRTTGEGPEFVGDVFVTTAIVVPCKLALLAYFGQYRVMWRYASVRELVGLVRGLTAGSLLTLAVVA